MKKLKKLWTILTQPAWLVALVGLLGFFADYLWRPISNAGLILLGFVVAPFLIKLVKRVSVGGVDLELLEQASEPEQQEKLEREAHEATNEGSGSKEAKSLTRTAGPESSLRERYIADEGLIVRELSSQSNGRIKREVKLADRIVDAVVTSRFETEVVEIKIFYSKFLTLENLTNAVRQISSAREYLQRLSIEVPVKARLIVAIDATSGELFEKAKGRVAAVQNSWPEVRIDLMLLPTLREKWGATGSG